MRVTISIHALREESDNVSRYENGWTVVFQSTLSVRRATGSIVVVSAESVFQSTLSVRRATIRRLTTGYRLGISIHALREESDPRITRTRRLGARFQSTLSVRRATRLQRVHAHDRPISIHALREESDTHRPRPAVRRQGFQSTLSVRRATRRSSTAIRRSIFQSTLSVRRATEQIRRQPTQQTISIHALREESDLYAITSVPPKSKFQSTLSVRRATARIPAMAPDRVFQSTLSVRRATQVFADDGPVVCISIHALREESDCLVSVRVTTHSVFQSTLSVRRATHCPATAVAGLSISIHALREESDKPSRWTFTGFSNFNPRSP